jgi:hypothetical protein
MNNCPHCGKSLKNQALPDGEFEELGAGELFLINYWMHRGFFRKDVCKALGRSVPYVLAREKLLWKKYAKDCEFFHTKRRKDGKIKLVGFYRNGTWFSVVFANNTTVDASLERWPRLHESWHIVAHPLDPDDQTTRVVELDDWAALGYVFTGMCESHWLLTD